MSNIIEMKNIHKFYKNGDESLEALKGVSFALEQGEILAIMGSSGSGKSTLLHIIGAMDVADEGEIYLNGTKEEKYGVEPDATRIRYENIGFVFQDFNLIQDFTVEENVSLPLILTGEKTKEIRRRTKDILEMVGIGEKGRNPVTNLSGGQRQRVAIARALINNPKILLADEPTGNLDSHTSEEVMKLMQQVVRQQKKTLVMVTHDNHLATYADRVFHISDGKIIKIEDHRSGTEHTEDRDKAISGNMNLQDTEYLKR